MADGDAHLQPGQQLGRYRITRELGTGGMGAVYEAVHTGLNKRVAMKVLHPSVDRDASVRARFLREGEVAARIRHPHVVDVHDVATESGVTYLVMDYLEGEDLAALLRREGPLTVERAVELLLPVMDAIHAAHEAGVVHRDLKPANIFLTRARDGSLSPKVLDFGISKILHDQPVEALTRTGVVMGTPHYMAPEQVSGARDLDGRADVYALGAIFYECVTGRRAFDGGSILELLMRIARSEFPPARSVRPDLPESVERITARAMHGDRDQRPRDARELARLLLPLATPAIAARWTPIFGAESRAATVVPAPPPPSRTPVAPGSPGGVPPHTLGDARPLTANLPARPSLRGPIAGIGAALVGAGVAWWLLLRPAAPVVAPLASPASSAAPTATEATAEPRPDYLVTLTVEPATAQLILDGKPVSTLGRLALTLPRDGTEHRLEISAPRFAPQQLTFRDAPPPAKVSLVPLGNNGAPVIR